MPFEPANAMGARSDVAEPPELPSRKNIGDVAIAAFRQDNTVVSTLSAALNSGNFTPDPNHNPLDVIKGTPYEARHLDNFVGSHSEAETRSIMRRIDQEETDRKVLEGAGVGGSMLSMLAGTLDPTIALPTGIALKAGKEGYTAVRSGAAVGAAVAGQVAAQETILQATQETRTAGESALNIASATLLGSLLGAGASRLLAPAERAALTKALDHERASMDAHAAGAPPPAGRSEIEKVLAEARGDSPIEQLLAGAEKPAAPDVLANQISANQPAGAPLAAAAGAAATDTRKLELVPAFGLEKVTAGFDPMSRLLNSESVAARRAAVDLAETPLSFKENAAGIPTTAGPALDRVAKLVINQTRVAVSGELDRLFSEYRFGSADPMMPRLRAQFEQLRGRGDGYMTYDGFKKEISLALQQGDKHDIPQVQAAAQFVRDRVFEPWKERAIAAGLLPEGVSTKTAESYFQRVYNKQAIAAQRPEFVNTVQSWLKSDQTTKAAAKDRLTWLNAQRRSWEQQISKFEQRFASIEAKGRDLGERLKERSMEVGRGENRVDALQDRSGLLAQGVTDVQEFVDAMKLEVTDPHLLARLDDLKRDASAAARADRPMTEAELKAAEKDELGSVLTGQTRMAAEMLTGRRSFPRGASFISWLVSKGGVKDVGGDVASILGGARRPGLINHARGHELDGIAQLISEEAPGHFPYQDGIPGHGQPSHRDVLDWIDGALKGREPDWWMASLPGESQEKLGAARFATALEEVFHQAGIEVKSIHDVAKVLRDGHVGEVTLADLDKIAADMEAAGAIVPPSVKRAAADDRLAAGVAEYQELRQVIARARETLDRKGARLREADARTGEAEFGVNQNRGRLGVLEDRLAHADVQRELVEEAAAIAKQQHGEVRAKIEAEVAAWEGKSASEAKSAIKAREAYATAKGRGPDEPRLASADTAVDRTVKRIIESDRDLTDAELRDRAHEITERVMGSADGRLPYDIAQGGPEIGYTAAGQPPRGPLAAREFNIPDELIRPWLEQDVEHVINTHLRTMVPDVLLTEKFGDVRMTEAFRKIEDDYAALIDATKSVGDRTRLGKERDAALRDLAAVRDRVRGVYGLDVFNSMRGAARTVAAVKNYNVISSMGMATVSSLPDMAGAVFRHGLSSAFRDAWAPFARYMMGGSDAWKEAAGQFRAMGIATESLLAQRAHALADVTDSYRPQSRVERSLQWGADKFQLVNLLAPWTDFGKINASMIAGSEILKASKALAEGGGNARQLRGLAENGIDRPMAERIHQAFQTGGEVRDGVHLPNTGDWSDLAARQNFEGAVAREADIAIVTPGQEKPLWLSNPIISVIGQFKSFTAAATQRILLANLQRSDAQVLQGVMFSMGLGMMSYKLNGFLGGQPTSDRPQDWIKESISRGNLLGWLEEGNALASKMTRGGVDMYRMIGSDKPLSRFASRSVLDQLLGPTAGKIENLTKVTGAAAARDWTAADTHALRRLQAFQNLFYLRGLLNQVEASGNHSLGVPEKAPPTKH